MLTANRKAFLDLIAFSEIGPALLKVSDNGYNVLVGSTPEHPLLFTSYATHPRIHNAEFDSDAAGRYQLMGRYFAPYASLLGLHDFSPASQDSIALQQIRERGALPLIDGGDIELAVLRCNNIWASFPESRYGQHEQKMLNLLQAYTDAGGLVS